MKIAAIGDLHINLNKRGNFKDLFKTISAVADVLLICGDITNSGKTEEAQLVIEELEICTIPVIAVLGNHDFDGGEEEDIIRILSQKMVLLDSESYILQEVGFAGVKGFCGGYDQFLLTALGENVVKQFVEESVQEALKLETALRSLETDKKVVLLHYAPIRETIFGEEKELYPYLGSSRLSRPIDHFQPTLVFHGHSHHGQIEGKTLKGIPVFNCALPLLTRVSPDKPFILRQI